MEEREAWRKTMQHRVHFPTFVKNFSGVYFAFDLLPK